MISPGLFTGGCILYTRAILLCDSDRFVRRRYLDTLNITW